MCDDMLPLAKMLDQGSDEDNSNAYTSALMAQIHKIQNPAATPSALVLQEMKDNEQSFHQLSLDVAKKHKDYFSELDINIERKKYFLELAKKSHIEQAELEAQDTETFEEYLKRYFLL